MLKIKSTKQNKTTTKKKPKKTTLNLGQRKIKRLA